MYGRFILSEFIVDREGQLIPVFLSARLSALIRTDDVLSSVIKFVVGVAGIPLGSVCFVSNIPR